jgi:DNA-binding transcriptional ArsR family regulator
MSAGLNASDMEHIRHRRERGDILRTLKEDYHQDMTSLRSLAGALDLQGIPLSQDGLEFHLRYLEDQGYVKIWRYRDLPNFRRDRQLPRWTKADTLIFARLLPKGLHLIDALSAEDPMVTF